MYKILFADDERMLRETVKDYMTVKGLSVYIAENGKRAVELAMENDFDLIILDVMMPIKNGIDACKEIRAHSRVPILFLSALGEEHDLLKGYGNGADDYIVKPFPLAVLYEKCIKMIYRYRGIDKENKIVLSGIILDKNKVKVYVDNKEIFLSNKDFQLLEYLMINKNVVLNRSIILNNIWGYEFDGDERVVDTHIKIIRKALGDRSKCIKTIVNVGYCLEAEK